MRCKTEHSDIRDLRSDFRVGEHVTDTPASHAEKRRPAIPADKPKGQKHSCREASQLSQQNGRVQLMAGTERKQK